MKSMHGIQEVLRHSLLEINNQCQGIWQDMAEFVNSVSTLPTAMVKVRLSIISINISMQASRLHSSHNWEGVVFVVVSDTQIGVHWAEKEFSIEAKENLKSKGYMILSLEETAKVVGHLSDEVDSGHFAEVVDWINRYEPYLV